VFVDTSVLVAIIADEPEAETFAAKLNAAKIPITSALVVLEASMRLSSLLNIETVAAEELVRDVLREAKVSVVPIDDATATLAVAAFAAYGKGRGHSAPLNIADCLSYACAKAHRAPLLSKGNDFSLTDIEAA
jgi:ribonuclease VapC